MGPHLSQTWACFRHFKLRTILNSHSRTTRPLFPKVVSSDPSVLYRTRTTTEPMSPLSYLLLQFCHRAESRDRWQCLFGRQICLQRRCRRYRMLSQVSRSALTFASSVPLELPGQIAIQAGRSLRLLTETVSMHRASEEHSET